MLLSELSIEVIREVLSYLEEPLYLGRLSSVCQTLCDSIRFDTSHWEQLYRKRWDVVAAVAEKREEEELLQSDDACSDATDSWEAYKKRHVLDQSLIKTIRGLKGLTRVLMGHHMRIDVDLENYHVLLAMMNQHTTKWCYPMYSKVSPTEQWLVWCIFRNVHFYKIRCDFRLLFEGQDGTSTPDTELLGRGALWLTEFLMDLADVSQGKSPKEILQQVKQDLDRLAEIIESKLTLQRRLRDDGKKSSALDATIVLAEDLGFSGNSEDYYNELNSSLLHVLQKKRGIPVTLAVIYKLLLHRLGFSVDIIGLPGHVVLGLDPETFLDVFNGGILSESDCQDIAARYLVPWDLSFIEPMDAKAVLSRMMRNILNCRAMKYNSRESIENMDSLIKTRDLLEFCHSVCNAESVSDIDEVPKPRDFLFDGRAFSFFETSTDTSSHGGRQSRTASF